MESNKFRKLLLLFAVIILIPIISSIYSLWSPVITGLIILIAIVIILLFFATRSESKPVSKGICKDIKSINIKVNGRSYIISEGTAFNTEDYEQPGILSYIENGVWYISDDPNEPANGAIAEITIPSGIRLDSLTVNVQSGNILINSAAALKSVISVYSDFAQIKSLDTQSLFASSGKGKLIINTALSGNAKLECGSGTLDAVIESSDKNFNIEAVTGNGSIFVNGEVAFDSVNRSGKIDNGAAHNISARCGLGNLNISFTEAANHEQD